MVTWRPTRADVALFRRGLRAMGEMMPAAGAEGLYLVHAAVFPTHTGVNPPEPDRGRGDPGARAVLATLGGASVTTHASAWEPPR